MRFFQHPDCNQVLHTVKGQSATGELEVGALPVQTCTLAGHPAIASYWLPDEEELQALLSGAPLVLQVVGDNQPAILMGVFDKVAWTALEKKKPER